MSNKQPDSPDAAAGTVRIKWTPALPAWVNQTYTDPETGLVWNTRDGLEQDVPAEHAERIRAIKGPNVGAFREVK